MRLICNTSNGRSFTVQVSKYIFQILKWASNKLAMCKIDYFRNRRIDCDYSEHEKFLKIWVRVNSFGLLEVMLIYLSDQSLGFFVRHKSIENVIYYSPSFHQMFKRNWKEKSRSRIVFLRLQHFVGTYLQHKKNIN